jgi:uncharacterized protein YjiS (DUF1127 family)
MSALTQSDLRDYHPILGRATDRSGNWQDKFRRALRGWRVRHQERRTLASLTERDFHDMGRTRWELEHELAKPFWRG